MEALPSSEPDVREEIPPWTSPRISSTAVLSTAVNSTVQLNSSVYSHTFSTVGVQIKIPDCSHQTHPCRDAGNVLPALQ